MLGGSSEDGTYTTTASKSDSVSLSSPDALQVGSEALERVAQALGARAALPQCRRLVREGLGGWTWQHQHAALSALGVLADGEWIEFAGWDGRLYGVHLYYPCHP